MAKVINLRTIRKQRARDEARAEASANAARHGQGKAEKSVLQANTVLTARKLDGHKREPGKDEPEKGDA